MEQRQIRIGSIGQEHYDECMALSQFAFQYKKTADELEASRSGFLEEPADRWAAFAGNRLAAQATVLELQTYIAGRPFAMGGVAGVATWPEYRRQGLVAKLLKHSLEAMREKGQTLSFLYPFAFAFYRKFGWETFTEHKHYTLEASQLPPRSSYEGTIERVEGVAGLNAVYQTYAARYNGSLARTELWWQRRIASSKKGQIALYRGADGAEQGYVIYQVEQRELRVHEMVALHEEAKRALWSFLAQHDSMIDKAKLTVPVDDTWTDLLPDPRIKQEIVPYFMARIVDVEAFLPLYPFLPGEPVTITLQVADEHALWNKGVYELSLGASGRCLVSRSESELPASEGVHLDIGALAMMMLGYRKGEQLSSSGRIHGDLEAINRLQSRIPERTTYLMDFF
jgi:Predicted acetyltransferase involved in intracellular survival and related acetyltransferases